jgi:hypothetical protein
VPHEVSQSASYIQWFTDYEYPFKSADVTPLYVIAHADHWRATGDRAFLEASWDSIRRAWRFAAATDNDGNGLIENTKVGHGWVEGGALHPAHEEIYLEGVWIQACRDVAELADAMSDPALAAEARAFAERTREAVEKTYWLADRGFYGFATTVAPEKPPEAEPGPRRPLRQKRLDALAHLRFVDEDTSLVAVPLWWHLLDAERAQSEIDHLGDGSLATDWGTRLLSSRSDLYDPLSYHNGSVWPLFTGWASMAAYRHGRPHVGWQAAMANVLLNEAGALGYVTELLSGEFNAPFSRSSHHQIWSEAMVVTPLVRGLLGVESSDAGRALRVAPQLPADWDHVALAHLAVGAGRYDLSLDRRQAGREAIRLEPVPGAGGPGASAPPLRLTIAPAFPLDARVRSVRLGGRQVPFRITREGDVQRAELSAAPVPRAGLEAVFTYDEGTDVYVRSEAPGRGASSQGLRILRSRADGSALGLTLEGLGGRTYTLRVRTPRAVGSAAGATARRAAPRDWELSVAFEGPADTYVRRELKLPLQ